jgi:hypothetical protein
MHISLIVLGVAKLIEKKFEIPDNEISDDNKLFIKNVLKNLVDEANHSNFSTIIGMVIHF